MTVTQMTNLIEWFKQLMLDFEEFFHNVQLWLDNDIYKAESGWFQNLIAEEGETEAE